MLGTFTLVNLHAKARYKRGVPRQIWHIRYLGRIHRDGVKSSVHAPFGILYLYKLPRIDQCSEDNFDSPQTLFFSP
jgi:hypothetical protein